MSFIKNITLLLLVPLKGPAQDQSMPVEGQLQSVYAKVAPACVRSYGIDSFSGAQNSAQFSAVVVSSDGIILTVAHAVKPGHWYKISFPDGRTGTARALGRIATDPQTLLPDVAMMQMTGKGPWPFAEMGRSSSLHTGHYCFGISYPESQNLLAPMLRQGHIIHALNEWGFVESSCIMETGDSGGPLFDEQGKVIGLHSRIDKAEGANYEVPIDTYRKYFTALQVVKNYDSLPEKTDRLQVDKMKPVLTSKMEVQSSVNNLFVKTKSEAVVTIYSPGDTILGTVFQLKNGAQVVVSKSSEVSDSAFINFKGSNILLKLLKRDRATDLVAFTVSHQFSQPVRVDSLKVLPVTDSSLIGRFLYTVLPGSKSKASIGGLLVKELPNRFSSGGFNANLQELNGCPTVVKLDSGGTAAKAGLKAGDCVMRINNVKVNGAKDFNSEMMKYYPGDSVCFTIGRQSDTLALTFVLVPRMLREQPHPMNHFEGGKSLRRDGFKNVILHDARIRSYECGSPLYDLKGDLVGLNIARFSHTTTIALNLSELMSFINTIH
ncbi:trypsin-like peptidase domain-containing protein [Niabella yanshanensis]|uniref:Trypsin-like peptidase domain-containing protein n=1 Tax=Niabella yanshanensis TaxID=577386 RepID=A0ABZ0W742_9BACT|nr:trypsin-like peptidase domain-containing protein [Niabella yanshanensis]WQD38956.1 trypsin-like peptidase domain-containing protein [Niabella yanshanensis]